MRILKISLTVMIALSALLGAGLYILANHSVTQTSLICSGKWQQGVGDWKGHSETVFAVIEEYRPWIVWGNSQGNLRAESREFPLVIYKGNITRIGTPPMVIFEFRDGIKEPMTGAYRSSFKELTLKFTGEMLFFGNCEQQL